MYTTNRERQIAWSYCLTCERVQIVPHQGTKPITQAECGTENSARGRNGTSWCGDINKINRKRKIYAQSAGEIGISCLRVHSQTGQGIRTSTHSKKDQVWGANVLSVQQWTRKLKRETVERSRGVRRRRRHWWLRCKRPQHVHVYVS